MFYTANNRRKHKSPLNKQQAFTFLVNVSVLVETHRVD
jgi:hypothetical protein